MDMEMDASGNDIMEELQQLIGDELEKYHEEKIRRDTGQESGQGPRPGMKPVIKSKLPQSLLNQYFVYN